MRSTVNYFAEDHQSRSATDNYKEAEVQGRI